MQPKTYFQYFPNNLFSRNFSKNIWGKESIFTFVQKIPQKKVVVKDSCGGLLVW